MVKPKHYEALREHLITSLGAIVSDNCEADDLVAMAASRFECVVVGQDKDLLQLKGWHYNPINGKFQKLDQKEADKHFWTQMLTGDTSDNIPGLKGVGKVGAAKALKECEDYSDMAKAVWEKYKDKGHDVDYLTEMGRLLWLQRYEGELWEPPKDLGNS
jgi:5'-3' exonuclease